MIGSTHPIIAWEIVRADIAARIREAEERALAAELLRERRAARAEARRSRRAARRPTRHRRPVLHLGRFIHNSTA